MPNTSTFGRIFAGKEKTQKAANRVPLSAESIGACRRLRDKIQNTMKSMKKVDSFDVFRRMHGHLKTKPIFAYSTKLSTAEVGQLPNEIGTVAATQLKVAQKTSVRSSSTTNPISQTKSPSVSGDEGELSRQTEGPSDGHFGESHSYRNQRVSGFTLVKEHHDLPTAHDRKLLAFRIAAYQEVHHSDFINCPANSLSDSVTSRISALRQELNAQRIELDSCKEASNSTESSDVQMKTITMQQKHTNNLAIGNGATDWYATPSLHRTRSVSVADAGNYELLSTRPNWCQDWMESDMLDANMPCGVHYGAVRDSVVSFPAGYQPNMNVDCANADLVPNDRHQYLPETSAMAQGVSSINLPDASLSSPTSSLHDQSDNFSDRSSSSAWSVLDMTKPRFKPFRLI